ncbi:MAG: hypothetical protein KIT19_06610 [Phycisphaeraceae bacterium]|nr:hypothetical protein [Phycisphaeraceae bacterium]
MDGSPESLENELVAKKAAYSLASTRFLESPHPPGSKEAKAEFRQWYSEGIAFFNHFERLLSSGSAAGLDTNDLWTADKVDSAINILGTVEQHYDLVKAKAVTYGFSEHDFVPSPKGFATMQRLVREMRPQDAKDIERRFAAKGLPIAGFKERAMARKLSEWEKIFAAVSGTAFLVVLLVLVVAVPNPTEFQEFVFRVVLALAAGAFSGVIAGFLNIEGKVGRFMLRAGSGLAVLCLVFLINPPKIIARPVPGPPPAPGPAVQTPAQPQAQDPPSSSSEGKSP